MFRSTSHGVDRIFVANPCTFLNPVTLRMNFQLSETWFLSQKSPNRMPMSPLLAAKSRAPPTTGVCERASELRSEQRIKILARRYHFLCDARGTNMLCPKDGRMKKAPTKVRGRRRPTRRASGEVSVSLGRQPTCRKITAPSKMPHNTMKNTQPFGRRALSIYLE